MTTLIILGLIGYFAYRHFSNKKRQQDIKNWGVDFRENKDIKPLSSRLPWKDL